MAATSNDSYVSADWARRPCPLCDSDKFPNSPEIEARNAAEKMPWNDVRDSFIGLRKDQVFFSYHRCSRCGLLYCPWYFSADQLVDLYSQMPDNLLGEEKATASKTQAGYSRWITRKVGEFGSYLELGPDIGLVTRQITAQIHPKQISLVEPNMAVHGELRRNVNGKGDVEIVTSLKSVRHRGFELSIGIHVFDHLLEPRKELNEIAQMSDREAFIGLVVHNEASLLRKLIGRRWPPFCLQHPQLYNQDTLEAMLKASGWRPEHVGRSTNYFHLNHLGQMGFRVLGLPASLSKLIPRIETPINLGNMIAVAKLRDHRE